MVRQFFTGILFASLSCSLSGCLALSFGGKTIEATHCTDEARISSLEARVSSLEQRLSPNLTPAGGMIEPQIPAQPGP